MLAIAAGAQPIIYTHRVLNAASFLPPGLPAGSIAQGSIFSIFGAGLGPAAGVQVSQFPLDANFNGVSIQVSQGAAKVSAIPIYVSAGQINAVMPSNAPLGRVSVVVTYNGTSSNPAPLTVAANSFGIFSVSSGIGPGIIQNFVSATQEPVNSTAGPATPGQIVVLWGTGLGPVPYADNIAPTAGNLPTKVEVFVGGQSASVSYSGRSPCCSGVDQLAFTVPQNAPLGCYVPVAIRTGGQVVSNTVTMAISADGGACSDSFNPPAATLTAGGNFGLVVVARAAANPAASTTFTGTMDYAFALFQQLGANPYFFNPVASLPPPGTCTAYGSTTELEGESPFVSPILAPWTVGGQALNAGQVSILGSGSTALTMAPGSPPLYITQGPLTESSPPSQYTISGANGTGVGNFQVNLTAPTPVTWTNQNSVSPISRASGFTVNWSGAGSQPVLILGQGVDLTSDSIGGFACLAPGAAGSFTVPALALANVPAARSGATVSGEVLVAALPIAGATLFSAAGLQSGLAIMLSGSATAVAFR